MSKPLSENISEKRYHLDKNYIDDPISFGDLLLFQIGRLHCTEHTVVGMHPHRNWFELTVVTDGAGTVIVGDHADSVSRGDIHLSFPGDFHNIRSDPSSPLKYDFLAFYPQAPHLLAHMEEIMQSRLQGDRRIIRDERIRNLLENAIAEINAPSEFATEILSSALLQIMLYLILDFRTESSVTKRTVSAQEDICYQIMHYIDTHIYTMDSLSELSGWMNYNYSYLSDLFKTVTGDTLQNYYQSRRLRAAQLLLSEGRLKLGEIANLLRYSSIYSFSRAFKDKYGIPPSEYRRK